MVVRTEGGKTVVSKLVDGSAVTTPVQVGMVQGAFTQVTSGIAEGDQVVITGVSGVGGGSGSQSTSTRTRGSGGTGGFGGGSFPAGAPGDLPAPPAGVAP